MKEKAIYRQNDLYDKSDLEHNQTRLDEYLIEANKVLKETPFDKEQYEYYIKQLNNYSNRIIELLK